MVKNDNSRHTIKGRTDFEAWFRRWATIGGWHRRQATIGGHHHRLASRAGVLLRRSRLLQRRRSAPRGLTPLASGNVDAEHVGHRAVTRRATREQAVSAAVEDQFLDYEKTHILCATHGAQFRFEDGLCVSPPCPGAHLTPVAVEISGAEVVIADN